MNDGLPNNGVLQYADHLSELDTGQYVSQVGHIFYIRSFGWHEGRQVIYSH